tara:strand:+ start:165 stop:794 length:630 start_codon:yes stop_codon:yes gene_type:complete
MGGFISFEGGEGAGKTTQLDLLEARFRAAHIPCVRTREPGGTAGAEAIRELIVTGDATRWSAATETLLLMAARFDHVEKVIAPALEAGQWVLCDRWLDSTLVYQGMSKKLGKAWIEQLHALLFGNLMPDVTFYLDIDPENGLKRTQSRHGQAETRFESMDLTFHSAVREGFKALASYCNRFVSLDATQEAAKLEQEISDYLNLNFNLSL